MLCCSRLQILLIVYFNLLLFLNRAENRWYCKYGISYRDLEEMMSERGLKLDHGSHHCVSLGSALCPRTEKAT